ncbi:DUF3307 domain-containing protein [Ichthyenterobacterium sp. W332]|uniref:DUF3307 domain-containing protein n=1 Tax=Microcosmobacter mediterraneus TaxID=3075607 RepID=A0ABU2YIR6_9FLAO|nr:DUF3307 domain-containing protein [Ichthyenterobacterium sp. W332]MDT0557670.1 DUF3307 domain-containing protein [Ichthyenterobacterium sp. W332]
MILLTKLILAHLVGDFILQPQSWVEEKEEKKLKSLKLYFHIGIHILLMFLFVWDFSEWKLILSIAAIHFLVDALKLILQKKKTKRLLFFIDQLLHIIAIVVAYYIVSDESINANELITENNLLLLTCLLFLTIPVSIIMRTIFSKWNIEELTKDNESLEDAGKYIGILERILVFIFIITGHWEAVGFLITAKSVFRFGDLKESKHRKLTEYILIGTLISFGIAIITGLVYFVLI